MIEMNEANGNAAIRKVKELKNITSK